MSYIEIEEKKFSRDPCGGVQAPKTFSSYIRKLTLEISSGTIYYYNSMKKSRFRCGRKNGLIVTCPLSFSKNGIFPIVAHGINRCYRKCFTDQIV